MINFHLVVRQRKCSRTAGLCASSQQLCWGCVNVSLPLLHFLLRVFGQSVHTNGSGYTFAILCPRKDVQWMDHLRVSLHLHFLFQRPSLYFISSVTYRGGFGVFKPPRNFEVLTKSNRIANWAENV